MDNQENAALEIENLKKEIQQEEDLMNKSLSKYKSLGLVCIVNILAFVYLLFMHLYLLSALFFVAILISIRERNKALFMAEFHNGARKFLTQFLLSEQTGDKSHISFLVD